MQISWRETAKQVGRLKLQGSKLPTSMQAVEYTTDDPNIKCPYKLVEFQVRQLLKTIVHQQTIRAFYLFRMLQETRQLA